MKTGILFPGYGSQYVGMGKELYDTQRLMQEYFEEAATCLTINFVKLCFASSEVELARVPHAYTALFLVGASSAGLIEERGLKLEVAAGIDIVSWYSALFAAGSISLPDGLYILNKLATLHDEYITSESHGARLIQASPREIRDLISDTVAVVVKGQDFCIIAGEMASLATLEKELKERAFAYKEYDIAGLPLPFISPMIASYTDYLEKIDFKDPLIPVVSLTDGSVITDAQQLRSAAREILTEPITLDLVYKQIAPVAELVLAIPSTKLRLLIAEASPERRLKNSTLISMDTQAEFSLIAPQDKEPDHGTESD